MFYASQDEFGHKSGRCIVLSFPGLRPAQAHELQTFTSKRQGISQRERYIYIYILQICYVNKYAYAYIYICIRTCICIHKDTHTHAHTHIYISIRCANISELFLAVASMLERHHVRQVVTSILYADRRQFDPSMKFSLPCERHDQPKGRVFS